jgi:hypothetical protein
LRGTSFGPPKELLLDLNRDLIQPPFSPLCPVLMVPDMSLKLSYPIFSGALLRQIARHPRSFGYHRKTPILPKISLIFLLFGP